MSGQARIWFRPIPKKDPTGAERQRRHRKKKKERAVSSIPAEFNGNREVAAADMPGLAARLVNGTATRPDTLIASALIMRLHHELAPGGAVMVKLAR